MRYAWPSLTPINGHGVLSTWTKKIAKTCYDIPRLTLIKPAQWLIVTPLIRQTKETTMYAEETTTTNQIKDIIAREILDSRGNPTIEADVILADGNSLDVLPHHQALQRAHEKRYELYGDQSRYLGKGVKKSRCQRQQWNSLCLGGYGRINTARTG